MKQEINFPFLLPFWTAKIMASSFLLWLVMMRPAFMQKAVTGGECREALSSEEAESISIALNTLMPDVAKRVEDAVRAGEERNGENPSAKRIDRIEKK